MGAWSRHALTQAEGIQHRKIAACGFSSVLSNEESGNMPDQCPGLGGCEEEAGVCARGTVGGICPPARNPVGSRGPWVGWPAALDAEPVTHHCHKWGRNPQFGSGVEGLCCSDILDFELGHAQHSGAGPWARLPTLRVCSGRPGLPWELWLEALSWWPAQRVPNCSSGFKWAFPLGFLYFREDIRVGSIHWTQAISVFCSRHYHWRTCNLGWSRERVQDSHLIRRRKKWLSRLH